MLRFLHHNQIVEEAGLPADLTILDYLREYKYLCGTKEGCASGDCGACTVVVADCINGGTELKYQSVNSCITFVGALHGKQLITVENLQNEQTLHPSQQSLVDWHGSQCGFCTPGFVMSLFAAMKNVGDESVSREYIDEQLGGNLCRCTGYRPIVAAAQQALSVAGESDQFNRNSEATLSSLRKIKSHVEVPSQQPVSTFHRPATVDELCQLRKRYPDAAILAGGTDLALRITQQLDSLDRIILIDTVEELDYFTVAKNSVHIGAGLSLSDLRMNAADLFPELEQLLIRFGGTQVRNQATVGGNFANASPVGDLPPVFIALNATVVLQSVAGTRLVGVDEFFVSYKNTLLRSDEFIREFVIPLSVFDATAGSLRAVNRFYKISKRLDDDISAVCAAFNLQMDGETIVSVSTGFGGMAEIPKRAANLEAVLKGSVLDKKCLQLAHKALEQDFTPIDDVRASANYRRLVSQNLLIRLATELYMPDVLTRVVAYDS